jgi:hypothetical protein
MQTFLPFESFTQSAACLDNKRLGKQRVECKQILQALQQGPYVMYDVVLSQQVFGMPLTDSNTRYKKRKTAWYNHPATQMWKDSQLELCYYALAICEEWQKRGFSDTLLDYFYKQIQVLPFVEAMPLLGNESFHQSHQSNLVRKDNSHYRKYFPTVPNNLPYIWSLPQ